LHGGQVGWVVMAQVQVGGILVVPATRNTNAKLAGIVF